MNSVTVRNLTIGEGVPKICIPIVERTKEDILRTASEILNISPDFVEWRADWYADVFDEEKLVQVCVELRHILGDMPILFTFRTKREGGEREIDFARYAKLLQSVANLKLLDLIDVEIFFCDAMKDLVASLKESGMVVIGSNHDFQKTPRKEEIIRRLCYMQDVGADILKIAVMPHSTDDVLTLLLATREMDKRCKKGPIITVSMSELGAISRISGEMFGSAVTFGTLKKASAPGQIDACELKKILKMLHCTQS